MHIISLEVRVHGAEFLTCSMRISQTSLHVYSQWRTCASVVCETMLSTYRYVQRDAVTANRLGLKF